MIVRNKRRSMRIEAKNRSILELPDAILIDVLSRLPIKTILYCMCVCKEWLGLVQRSDFTKSHLPRSPKSLLLHSLENIFLVNLDSTDISCQTSRIKLCFNINFPRFGDYYIADSCNGLLCICHKFIIHVYILNPVTGDYIILPGSPHRRCKEASHGSLRLGFCPTTNQCKVLLLYRVANALHSEIHTVGTNSWRLIAGDAPSLLHHTALDCILNGYLHLLVKGSTSSEYIYSFDFEDETFQPFPAPSEFAPDGSDKKLDEMGVNLTVLISCLCMGYYSGDQYEIWMMKEYGVQGSWSRQFIISAPVSIWGTDSYLPIKLINNGESLMLIHNKEMFSYNFEEKRLERVRLQGTELGFEAYFSHRPSFLSFNDVESLKVFNVKRTGNACFSNRGD